MEYDIKTAPILANLYKGRLSDGLVPDINKSRSFRILQRALELQREKKADELVNFLRTNENIFNEEYLEHTPNFFLHCRMRGAYYNLLATGLHMRGNNIDLPDILKYIRMALVCDTWQLMFDLNEEKEERSYAYVVNEHVDELASYQTLKRIKSEYPISLQDFEEQYFVTAEKDLFCLTMGYDIIKFYRRNHTDISPLTRAFEIRVATECIYAADVESDTYEKICKCANHMMDGIIKTDEIDEVLKLIEDEFTLCVSPEPFIAEWEDDKFTQETALEYVAAHIHPQFEPKWYFRYEAERNLNKVHELEGVIAQGNSKTMDLTDRIANLERELAIRNNELSVLKAEKGELTRKNIGLENKLQEISKTQDVLSKSVANQKRSVNGANRKQNKELVKLSADYNNLKEKYNELQKQKDDYVHKYQDAIGEKIALSDKISELRDELRKKTKALDALSVQDIKEEPVVEVKEEPVEGDIFTDINLKVAVAGGTDSWRAKVTARHPKFKDIGNSKGFDTQKLNDVDLLVINTNNVSHSCTMKASANTPGSSKVLYTSYYNLDLLDAQIIGRIE